MRRRVRRTRVEFIGTLRTVPDEINDFEDAERVDDEKCDEPTLLTAACRVPKRVTLDEDRPKCHYYENRNERGEQGGREWRIKWCVRLHIRRLYHTLRTMRYLGIDYGTKKIGLALSDEAGTMGFPHSIIPNTPRLVDELGALIAKENVGVVVVGESRDLAGGENPIAKDAQTLGTALTEHLGVPVFYESEVFTSAEARRMPEKQEKTRAPKARVNVDASAAALILTSYLSHTKHGPH